MPGGKKSGKGNGGAWGQIRLGSFRAEFPQPRIPRLLGAAHSLGVATSVYPRVRLDVPIVTQQFNVAAGGVAASIPLDTTAPDSWSARFASLFREYAIVGAALEVRVNNVAVPSGVVACFIDEEVASAPSSAQALNRPRLDVLMAQQSVPGAYMLKWTPRDILDLDFVSTSTTFTPAWLKLYTDSANFGTQATTTGQVLVTGTLAFEFRGYN